MTWLVSGLLLATLLLAAHAEVIAEPPPFLRYVTLNLHHGGFFWGLVGNDRDLDARLEIVADELRALGADIVGLQEASVTPTRGHVAQRLAARLGFHLVYAPALELMHFSEGPAIMSRFPILTWDVFSLPHCGRLANPRVMLYAELETPWGPLSVFSTHTAGDACHTRHVASLVRARLNGLPGVLMGDFNAVEGSPAVAALTDEAGFIDVFRVANPTAPGHTDSQRTDAEVPTVAERIDYLFLVPGADTRERVLSSRVVLNVPRRLPDGRALWPSDHYGVLAEIDVFPSRARAGR